MDGITGGGGYLPPPIPPPIPGFPGAPTLPSSYSSPSGCSCAGCNGKSQSYSPNSMTPMNVQSWFDTPLIQPLDPRILIANADFGGLPGAFVRTTNYGAGTWGTNSFVYAGTPKCESLHTDDALAVAEAAQWTFSHQIINVGATNPPALKKVAFMRAGMQYQMDLDIDLGGSNYTDMLLSFRDNAAVPGDFVSGTTGSIPVIIFTGTLTGQKTLKVTLRRTGTFIMGLKAVTGGVHSMFEMEWVVVR